MGQNLYFSYKQSHILKDNSTGHKIRLETKKRVFGKHHFFLPEVLLYYKYWRISSSLGHCAFGIHTDMQNDINNEFMLKAAACFDEHVERNQLTKLSYLMPWLTPLLIKFVIGQLAFIQFLHRIAPTLFPVVTTIPTMWFQSKVDGIVDARTTSSEITKRNDLLQLLLDAAAKRHDVSIYKN